MELFIDIETIARPGAEVLLPEPQAPANYKDEAKIAKYIEEARAKQVEKMALDVDCCEITTIAWALGDGDVWAYDSDYKMNGEADLLVRWWWRVDDALKNHPWPLVGYNIGAFDLPVLMRRSFLRGVTPAAEWQYRKYQTDSVLDLMQVFYHWTPPYRSLRFVCELCGIEPPIGDGADVGAMSPEERIAHCKSDVEAVRELYYKGKGWYW
jgi:hypothetical protein